MRRHATRGARALARGLAALLLALLALPVPAALGQDEPAPADSSVAVLGEGPRALGGRFPDLDPALSPDGRWLVWSRWQDSNWDLWLLDLDEGFGQPARRLTEHPARDARPRFSPDGRRLVFVSERDEAAGDVWGIEFKRTLGGGLKPGEPRLVMPREGVQDHPALDAAGRLYWDEETPEGPAVFCLEKSGAVRRMARPAVRPVPAAGALHWLSVEAGRPVAPARLPDSLRDARRPDLAAERLWTPAGGAIDLAVASDGRLWLIGLESPARPGDNWADEGTLWALSPGAEQGRPLLPENRRPRQLALGVDWLVLSEGRDPPTLSLVDRWGALPPASASAWLRLWRSHRSDSLAIPLLKALQAEHGERPEAEIAVVEELRLRLSRGEDPAPLAATAAAVAGRFADADRERRRALLEQVARLRVADADSLPGSEERPAAVLDSLGGAWAPTDAGASAEARLELARWRLARGEARAALDQLLPLKRDSRGEPEAAEAALLKVRAWEALGQDAAALGALRELATDHASRPDLLRAWLEPDLAALRAVPGDRGLLRLRRRLAALGSVRSLRLALGVELARREGRSVEDLAVALEDLDWVLRESPAELTPFEREVWAEGWELKADLLAGAHRVAEGLDGLATAEAALVGAGARPGPIRRLRQRRLAGALQQAREAATAGDPPLASAQFARALALDGSSAEAMRGWLSALAAQGRLDEAEPGLRAAAEDPPADPRAEAFASWALGLLLSWQAADDPSALPESDLWLEQALSLDPAFAPAYLTFSWNLSRELDLVRQGRQGLKGLWRDVKRSRQAWKRLRHRGLAQIEEPDEETLRDRAVFLLERGLELTGEGREPELEAAMAQNLGNLWFSLGEFGAERARSAWLRRLAVAPDFSSPRERLLFLQNLGVARHWAGDLEGAVADLDSAQQLAARLDEGAMRKALTARLGQLAGERGEPAEARRWLQRALALEADPGQRALLWRNLALVLRDLGEDAAAAEAVARSRREAEEGDWPVPREQNWLRIRLFGLGLPLWNFPGLYTGQGRLDWGPDEEELLRLAIEAELEGRAGREDRRMEGLHERRRLLRRQGDREGMTRLDLAIARRLAGAGRFSEAAARFDEAGRRAENEELGAAAEALALQGTLGCLWLAEGRGETLSAPSVALRASATRRVAERLASPTPPPARLRAGLFLVLAQERLRAAEDADPAAALLEAGELQLELEDLRAELKLAGWTPAPAERFALDLAALRLGLALGETAAAAEALRGLEGRGPAPDAALALRLEEAGFDLALLSGDAAALAVRIDGLRRALEALPPQSDRRLEARLLDPLLRRLDAAAEGLGPETGADQRDWTRWWRGRRALEASTFELARATWTNAWRNFAADEVRLQALRRERWSTGADSLDERLERLAAWCADDRARLAGDDRMRLWVEHEPVGRDLVEAWRREGLGLAGVEDSSALYACEAVHARLRANSVLGSEEVAVLSAAPPPAAPGRPSAGLETLLEPGTRILDARLLAVEADLTIDRGLPHGARLVDGSARIDLLDLFALDLPGEALALRSLKWEGDPALGEQEGWLWIERWLAQSGLRALLVPRDGRRAGRDELLAVAEGWLAGEEPPAGDGGWLRLGCPPLPEGDRERMRREGFERLVRLGNHFRREEQPDRAWRAYRRGLDLALRLGAEDDAGRLLLLASASAVDGSRPAEALAQLEPLMERLAGRLEDPGTAGRRLTVLADLAGRPTLADSLWMRWVLRRPVASATEWEAMRAASPAPMPGTAPWQEVAPEAARRLLEARLQDLQARGAVERAAALAREAGLRPVEGDPLRALFLGKLYLDGDWAEDALACLEAPQAGWETLEGALPLERADWASVAALRLGALGDARRWMERADSLALAAPPDSARLALHELRRADLAWARGVHGEAAAALEKARRLAPPGDDRLWLLAENTAGLLALDLGETGEAGARLSAALERALRLGDPLETSAVRNNLARLALARGRGLEALELAEAAAADDSLSGSRRRALATLRSRAGARLALAAEAAAADSAAGWLDRPETLLAERRAKSRLRELEGELEQGRVEARALGDRREELRIDLLAARLSERLGEDEAVAARARAVREAAESAAYGAEEEQAALLEGRALRRLGRERNAGEVLRRGLDRAERRLAESRGEVWLGGRRPRLQALVDELVDLLAEDGRPLEALVAAERGRRVAWDELAARRGLESPPLDAAALERLLGREARGGAVVAWQAVPGRVWRFVFEDGELSAEALPLDRAALAALVERHRGRLLRFQNGEGSARELAEALLPAAWLAAPPKRALLLPHGPLHALPFATLRLDGGRDWLETTALRQSDAFAPLAVAAARPLADGPPTLWHDPAAPGQPPLEFAGLESASVLESWPAGRLSTGEAASEAALAGASAPSLFRHFGCHALHDPRSPAGSALLLAPGGGADGRLTAPELAALELPCELATLSACETGLGRSEGEESGDLPRAFVAAGARGVVASLWKVEDLATAVLVKHFYRELAAGQPPDEALRRAQLAVREWVHPHPAWWAGFFLSGGGGALPAPEAAD